MKNSQNIPEEAKNQALTGRLVASSTSVIFRQPLDGFGGAIYNAGEAAFSRCLICSNYVYGCDNGASGNFLFLFRQAK
jgi:hypothetical protein